MHDSMLELEKRFEKIKDHKPQRATKLSELGYILANVYHLNPNRANEMWQYLVELNVTEKISSSKFYIAQIFGKIEELLSPEEATNLISMVPERVELFVNYGYSGRSLWQYFNTLINGYIRLNSPDGAMFYLKCLYNKFGGIWSEQKEVFRLARKGAEICIKYINNNQYTNEAKRVLQAIGETENPEINLIVETVQKIELFKQVDDYESMFFLYEKCRDPIGFSDLLATAKGKMSQDVLVSKWVSYIEKCEENEVGPYSLHYDKDVFPFYVKMMKNEPILLNHYFNRPTIYAVEYGVIYEWIYDEDWKSFVKYISKTIMATSGSSMDYVLKSNLKRYMDACFSNNSKKSQNFFEENYDELMRTRAISFARALAEVLIVTKGCECYKGLLALIKQFVQDLTGDLEILNEVGLNEKIETRSAEEKLKDYIHIFLKSAVTEYKNRTTEYDVIMDSVYKEISDKSKENVDDEFEKIQFYYRLALDQEVVRFYFVYFTTADGIREQMILSCIKNNNVKRAYELIEIMNAAKDLCKDPNEMEFRIMKTMKSLVILADYSKKGSFEAKGITDTMRQMIKELAEYVLSILPVELKETLSDEMYRIAEVDQEKYITSLLKDVSLYCTFPRTLELSNASVINRLGERIWNSFEILSAMNRLDVIQKIMLQFVTVKDLMTPIRYDTWVSLMMMEVEDKDIVKILNEAPEIFEAWLAIGDTERKKRCLDDKVKGDDGV